MRAWIASTARSHPFPGGRLPRPVAGGAFSQGARGARYVGESRAGETPVGSPPPLADLVEELELRTLVRRGGMDADRFEEWLDRMVAHSVRLHHPAQVAHQVGVPDVPAAISDLVQGAINQPMSIYEMGPAAHAAERVVVEWMVEKLGWGE